MFYITTRYYPCTYILLNRALLPGQCVVTAQDRNSAPSVPDVSVSAHTIPTGFTEADDTFKWNSTTIVLVKMNAGGKKGLGYTYANLVAVQLIRNQLANVVQRADAMMVPEA